MKSRVKNQYDRKMAKRVEELLTDYGVFLTVVDGIARQMVAAMLYAYHLKGYREKRINDMFEEFLSVNSMPGIFGKSIEAGDIMTFLTEKYGIDFKRVIIKTETADEYVQRKLKEEKERNRQGIPFWEEDV